MFWSPSWSMSLPEEREDEGTEKPHVFDRAQVSTPLRRRRPPPPITAPENIEQDKVFLFPSTPSPSSSATSVSPFSDCSCSGNQSSSSSPTSSPKSTLDDVKSKLFPRPSRLRRRKSTMIRVKDFTPPDVSGLSKQEARVIKNRAAAFLSRQRRREEYEFLEVRVAELEEENTRLRDALADLATRSSSERERSIFAPPAPVQCSPSLSDALNMSMADVDQVSNYFDSSPLSTTLASIDPEIMVRDEHSASIQSPASTIFSLDARFMHAPADVEGNIFEQLFAADDKFHASLQRLF